MKLRVGVGYTECIGIPIHISRALQDQLRYLSPKANAYNKAYAEGYWDGFVNLYDPVGLRFPTGLVPRVKRVLTELAVPFEVQPALPPLPDVALPYTPKHKLRSYQESAVAAALKWKRGVISIPTGGGKTEVAQTITHRISAGKVVFFVPTLALLNQTVERFKEVFPDTPVLKWGDGSKPPAKVPDTYILIATVQSAFKKAHPLLSNAEAVFIDEAHHQASTIFKEATMLCQRARYIYGLTATPFRSDGADMEIEAWIGPIIYAVSYTQLIDDGYLVPPEFYTVPDVLAGMELTKGKRTLVFSEKVEDIEKFRPLFEQYGAAVLTGKDVTKVREKVLQQFRDGNVTHIVATPLFDEGLDVGDIEAVFFFATCGSKTRAIQRIGRAMRNGKTLDGNKKASCMVVDLRDRMYHARMKAYVSEPAFKARLQLR